MHEPLHDVVRRGPREQGGQSSRHVCTAGCYRELQRGWHTSAQGGRQCAATPSRVGRRRRKASGGPSGSAGQPARQAQGPRVSVGPCAIASRPKVRTAADRPIASRRRPRDARLGGLPPPRLGPAGGEVLILGRLARVAVAGGHGIDVELFSAHGRLLRPRAGVRCWYAAPAGVGVGFLVGRHATFAGGGVGLLVGRHATFAGGGVRLVVDDSGVGRGAGQLRGDGNPGHRGGGIATSSAASHNQRRACRTLPGALVSGVRVSWWGGWFPPTLGRLRVPGCRPAVARLQRDCDACGQAQAGR